MYEGHCTWESAGTGMPSNRAPKPFLDLSLAYFCAPNDDSLDNRDKYIFG